jgi:UDP-glucose 4-epimerase
MAANVLLTGASGFIGGHLLSMLQERGHRVRACARHGLDPAPNDAWESLEGCGLDRVEQWAPGALADIDVVIHTAALAHVAVSDTAEALEHYRAVNTHATRRLAELAAVQGVKRFIFLSSIKVNGESTQPEMAFTAFDIPAPTNPYAVSKWEAEQGLQVLARETGMEVVIIRPPLVYGPGVKANFRALLEWFERGVPLPLASVENRRSLVGLDNLVDLIVTCIDHPAAANQTFLVSDNHDLSTPGLIGRLSLAMGREPRLFPFPVSVLRKAAEWVGRGSVASRLCDSLQVDIRHTMDTLGWTPPFSVEEGIQKTVDDFMARRFGGEHKQSYKEIRGGGAAPAGDGSAISDVGAGKKLRGGDKELRREGSAPTGGGSAASDVGAGKKLRGGDKELRREGSAPTSTRDGESRESGRG